MKHKLKVFDYTPIPKEAEDEITREFALWCENHHANQIEKMHGGFVVVNRASFKKGAKGDIVNLPLYAGTRYIQNLTLFGFTYF